MDSDGFYRCIYCKTEMQALDNNCPTCHDTRKRTPFLFASSARNTLTVAIFADTATRAKQFYRSYVSCQGWSGLKFVGIDNRHYTAQAHTAAFIVRDSWKIR